MALYLHNPTSSAHLDELRERLTLQLVRLPRVISAEDRNDELVDRLINTVRAMDQGSITPREALETFAAHRVPGFSFGRWFVDMVDEGVYLEAIYNDAA